MAIVTTDNQHYADIAAAIRSKNGTETLYKPSEMAAAIQAISGGGADIGEGKYLCRVIDYDGKVLLEKRGNNGDTVTLPTPLTHDRLVFQGWSCSQEVVGNTVTFSDNNISVGAMYETASGKTEFDITLTRVTGLTVTFQNLTGMTEIDWGDGTTDSALTHTYSDYGNYIIQVSGVTGLGSYIFNQSGSIENYYCTATRIGGSVTSIGSSAFSSCYSLTSVVIPQNVTSIGSSAFSYNSTIVIYDFRNAISIPTLSNTNVFDSINDICVFIIPDTLYDEWIAATNWSTYIDYIYKASEVAA